MEGLLSTGPIPSSLNSDTQEHALICLSMRNLITNDQVDMLKSVTYYDIFSDIEKQYKITLAFELIIQTRENWGPLPLFLPTRA